eukprot:5899687-Ditylum_brightwellii.AAC.1
MARTDKTKERKYMAQAKCIHKDLTNSLKNKSPNVLHYVSSLNGEKDALKQKRNQENMKKLYNDAIIMSACDYLLNIVGDFQETKYRIEGAINCCTNWGAMGVVDHLHNKYKDVLASSSAH